MFRTLCFAALAACAAAQSVSEIDAEISRLSALRTQHVRRSAGENPKLLTDNDNLVGPSVSLSFPSFGRAPDELDFGNAIRHAAKLVSAMRSHTTLLFGSVLTRSSGFRARATLRKLRHPLISASTVRSNNVAARPGCRRLFPLCSVERRQSINVADLEARLASVETAGLASVGGEFRVQVCAARRRCLAGRPDGAFW